MSEKVLGEVNPPNTLRTGIFNHVRGERKKKKNWTPKFVVIDTRNPSCVTPTLLSPHSKPPAVDRRNEANLTLERQFGRLSLPTSVGCRLEVKVSDPDWKGSLEGWKYQLEVQARDFDPNVGNFANASISRSLADFAWLESALQTEFSGSLLLPVLSEAVGTSDFSNDQQQVKGELLGEWLSDILNGIRCQGELVLEMDSKAVVTSEAIQIFLYLLSIPQPSGHHEVSNLPPAKVVMENVLIKAKRGRFNTKHVDQPDQKPHSYNFFCGYPGLMVSGEEARTHDLLHAEQDLISVFKVQAQSCRESLKNLGEEEAQVAAAWKKISTCLKDMLAFEKDIKKIKVQDGPDYSPYAVFLNSNRLEDTIDEMLEEKMERTMPNLKLLGEMIKNYDEDMTTVENSFYQYSKAAKQLETLKLDIEELAGPCTFTDPFKELKALVSGMDQKEMTAEEETKVAFERIIKNHENMLTFNVGTLCKNNPIRIARMANRYFQEEAAKAQSLKAASFSLLSKAFVPKKSVEAMEDRHDEEDRKDQEKEVALVEDIANIRKQSKDDATKTSGKTTLNTLINDDDTEKLMFLDYAVKVAQTKPGRWNAKRALAVLKAVGLEDSGKQKMDDETHQIHEVIKKLANTVEQCMEAADIMLLSINDAQREFTEEMTTFFGASSLVDPFSADILGKEGIQTKDGLGWAEDNNDIVEDDEKFEIKRGRCRELVEDYFENKDYDLKYFLKDFMYYLEDYQDRVAAMENFVYMRTVCVQIESHFEKTPENLWIHNLKEELDKLACRLFARVQEESGRGIMDLMRLWAKKEEKSASRDMDNLQAILVEIQTRLIDEQLPFYAKLLENKEN